MGTSSVPKTLKDFKYCALFAQYITLESKGITEGRNEGIAYNSHMKYWCECSSCVFLGQYLPTSTENNEECCGENEESQP